MMFPLTDASGYLTPIGLRAQQVYNDYVAAGMSPMVAAQVLGGQMVEDPALNAAQIQSTKLAYAPDGTIIDLYNALDTNPDWGVGFSQWTVQSRQQQFMDFINNNYNPHDNALDASAAFTVQELNAAHYKDVAKTQSYTFLEKLEQILANAINPMSAASDLQTYIENKYEKPRDRVGLR